MIDELRVTDLGDSLYVIDALMHAGRETGTSRGVPDAQACKRIVHQLCFVMDRNIKYRPLSNEELGNLRCGLNAVHKLLWAATARRDQKI